MVCTVFHRSVLRRAIALITAVAMIISPAATFAQTTVAGFTPGGFQVTESGAAVYSIPIQVPPGTAGVEPKLALTYNSQRGNGLAGVGWALDGLMAIHRCGRTLVQDGINAGVDYSANDRYCLDGQRLVMVAGSAYGGNGTEYRTERESFTKVISYGTAGSGPAWFKLWTKSGLAMEFGNTTDSRIEAQGKSDVRVYAVNKLTDTKGNYLTVTYFEDNANGDYYPTRIDYTGQASGTPTVNPYASVQFAYETRTDNGSTYVGGSKVSVQKRLTNVKTYFGTTAVRDYRLAYEYAPLASVSRLTSVTECNGAGTECLPATSFSWQGPSNVNPFLGKASWNAVLGEGPPGCVQRRFLADVNGDGFADWVYTLGGTAVYVKYSSGSGFGGATQVATDSSHGYWDEYSAWVPCAFLSGVGDVNGDGRADMLFGDGTVMLATDSGFASKVQWNGTSGPLDVVANRLSERWLADVNGDGYADLIYLNYSTTVYVKFSNGSSFGSATSAVTASTYQDPEPPNQWFAVILDVGDVNRDGRADLLFSNGTVSLGTATGFASPVGWNGAVTWSLYLFDPTIGQWLIDTNGDGFADLVHTSNSTYVYVKYSDGNSFGAPIAVLYDNSYFDGESTYYASVPGVGDTNGDGRADVVTSDGYVALAQAVTPHLLGTITSGLGATTTVTYKPLTDGSVYTKDTDAVWPVRDLKTQGPLYAVSSTSQSDGIGGNFVINYFYWGAKAHMKGAGFLGFRKVEATDAQTQIKTATTFRQEYRFKGLSLEVEKTRSGTTVFKVTNSWTENPSYNALPYTYTTGNYHRADLTQIVERSYELNGSLVTKVTTNTGYEPSNDYGNPKQIYIRTAVNETGYDGYCKVTNNTYHADDTANWVLGRLKTATAISKTPPDGLTCP